MTTIAVQSFAAMTEVPLAAITPRGWLRTYLEKQRDGLTGHLEVAGFPFNSAGWGADRVDAIHGDGWWPYEQTGYWIDGMIRCGRLLGDDFVIGKAQQSIDFVLNNADPDGYLGPKHIKPAVNSNRWAHAVFFRALMAEYAATGDERILQAVANHYRSHTSPHSDGREVCNVEGLCWAYAHTGDPDLLDQAVQAYAGYNTLSAGKDTTLEVLLSDKVGGEHGVTYNEIGKLGAILYCYTGERRYLDAAVNGYWKLDRDQMLIDGVNSSTEGLRGKDPLDSHETCDIADYTWSVGYLLLATGEADYAEKIERACFNAAPGAVKSDFTALQYFSCPNQVVADAHSNHNLFYRGRQWMSYRPNPGTECCPGEVNRIMPNYVARMWLREAEGGVVAALYGPSTVTLPLGAAGQPVTITEETDYPFDETITFTVQTETAVDFTLVLRIPAWCDDAQLAVNGTAVEQTLTPGTFVRLARTWQPGDVVTLVLPMAVRLSHWPRGGVGVERGPLVYALRIEEDWQTDLEEPRCTPEFPAWNCYPASRWNYALALDEGSLDEIAILTRPLQGDPWSLATAPIELQVPARRVKGWAIRDLKSIIGEYVDNPVGGGCVLRHMRVKGRFLFTPQLPDPETLPKRLGTRTERVTLVPYGCTHLRIAVFPWAGR